MFKTPELFSAIIIITVIFVLVSAGFVIFIVRFKMRQGLHFQEKKRMADEFSKQLMQSQIEVQETTMSMLGQELHDNICQQMSSTKLLASYALRRPESAVATLTEIEFYIGNTINDIRQLTRSLDKEWLERFSLVDNLEMEINRINAAQLLRINLLQPESLPIEANKQLMLFRIVQEALQNAVRHSGASEIDIIIQTELKSVNLAVRDNGKGFISDNNSGLGMRNMKYRTKLLDGAISWDSNQNGSCVTISVPISEIFNEN